MFVGQVINGLKVLSDVVEAVAGPKEAVQAGTTENAAFAAAMKRAANQLPATETLPVFPLTSPQAIQAANLQTSAFMASGLQSMQAASSGLIH
jgi:hypothetical protein